MGTLAFPNLHEMPKVAADIWRHSCCEREREKLVTRKIKNKNKNAPASAQIGLDNSNKLTLSTPLSLD